MPGTKLGDHLTVFAESEGEPWHIRIIHAWKERAGQFVLGYDTVGAVNADLTSCIDSVLALPAFNEPGSAPVIEIDGQTVEDHIEMGSRPVKKGAVAEIPLPGIQA